jgi:hypothetical protein
LLMPITLPLERNLDRYSFSFQRRFTVFGLRVNRLRHYPA